MSSPLCVSPESTPVALGTTSIERWERRRGGVAAWRRGGCFPITLNLQRRVGRPQSLQSSAELHLVSVSQSGHKPMGKPSHV
ncbi:hypothetical protein EYF80_064779 [Liparis tanakae]|uniref:Uncharacterized protein n=1 Tax=Liparis tanakae TaxID=230148 RepID=A0A4Z2E8T9_9TELE|nr:hypothetical protein EYF80_064779 [Liparis tanakae]